MFYLKFKNLYCISKKTTQVDDLIDIDLVKGSTFPKPKFKQNVINIVLYGILKCVFFPYYFKWFDSIKYVSFKAKMLIVALFLLLGGRIKQHFYQQLFFSLYICFNCPIFICTCTISLHKINLQQIINKTKM